MALFTFAEVLTLKPLLSLSNDFSSKYRQKNASPHLRVLQFSTLILELVPHQPQRSILRPVVFSEWDLKAGCKADGCPHSTEI